MTLQIYIQRRRGGTGQLGFVPRPMVTEDGNGGWTYVEPPPPLDNPIVPTPVVIAADPGKPSPVVTTDYPAGKPSPLLLGPPIRVPKCPSGTLYVGTTNSGQPICQQTAAGDVIPPPAPPVTGTGSNPPPATTPTLPPATTPAAAATAVFGLPATVLGFNTNYLLIGGAVIAGLVIFSQLPKGGKTI